MLAALKRDFFTTSGRIGRLRFLKLSLKAGVIAMLIMVVAVIGGGYARYAFLGLATLALAWLFVANATIIIRRLHDHDRKGWPWLGLVIAAAVAGYVGEGVNDPVVTVPTGLASLAMSIYLSFIRGTEGPNDYGPDPVADAAPERRS